jgi:hypothetical protein
MQETIQQAKENFLRAKARLAHALATTPDDRIDWSPSPTSRTPLQQVAHAAVAIHNIQETLSGRTFAVPTPEEADRGFREEERQYKTREQVLDLLERHGAAYVAWLDALTPEQLATPVTMPFGMGELPVGAGLGFPADHANFHTAQIDYIQTIYGDHDWHMN